MHVQLKWRLSDFLPKDKQQNSDTSGPIVSLWDLLSWKKPM